MASTIALIDYGSGNVRSAQKALQLAAAESQLDANIVLTSDPDLVRDANRIVLPGVGAFGDCRKGIKVRAGLWEAIEEAVIRKGRPFLGICVGMQLMAKLGLEHGRYEGFGWIDGQVEPIKPSDPGLKIPHMGWNALSLTEAGADHPVTEVFEPGDHVYFVHSYQMQLASEDSLLGTTDYAGQISAVVGQQNYIGTQFHPEKSQAVGVMFLQAFLEWWP